MARRLITGPNFSGRSGTLRSSLGKSGSTFFVGPYAEAALSGLSSNVADEIALYRTNANPTRTFDPLDITRHADRRPQTLSGGEQVLLALYCFAASAFEAVAIDTALEQLDGEHRNLALGFLASVGERGDVTLIDNRIETPPPGWSCIDCTPRDGFACRIDQIAGALTHRTAPAITIRGLDFHYREDEDVFRQVDLTLESGQAYRLAGANGAGKTTLLKLLVGVLAPCGGQIQLEGVAYEPWRRGNAAFALAMQNPDHQWCGATLGEDIARRRSGLRRRVDTFPSDETFAAHARKLGIDTLDQHLYELPLAARKRLTWLWPFAGVMPWVMLDEPTVGQDRATRDKLADALAHLCGLGYGVLFVTHDDEFAASVPHRVLRVADKTISAI